MFQANVYKIMIGAPSDIKEEVSIAMNTYQRRGFYCNEHNSPLEQH